MFVIYHNPRCSKSRATLALLRSRGVEPAVVDYLATPLDLDALRDLHAALGCPARDMLRSDGPERAALGLDDPDCADSRILEAIAAHPHLLQRPIVAAGDTAVIGRPPEAVLALIGAVPEPGTP
ncbi:MAG TPA: arsenate reductase (glutaredoxin) [Xanthomonadaceae bacterium]|nr:arsenate reductase (glutaredoxin) [Xanthomonadaceae bacterium]